MKKVFKIFAKAPIQDYPLVSSLALAAKDLGYEVQIFTQNSNKQTVDFLKSQDIKIFTIVNKIHRNPILKLMHWYKFGNFCRKNFSSSKFDVNWVCGADTGISIGRKFLIRYNFYFQINELYDRYPKYLRRLKALSHIASQVIVPEENRAQIFRSWFGLKILPSTLYNKPYFDKVNIISPSPEMVSILDEIRSLKKENVLFLYQGHIGKDRDLTNFIMELNKFENVRLIVMGYQHDSVLEKYIQISNKVLFVPPIPSPAHLLVTELADVGIMIYIPSSLNNIYCAPNKTWEYTKFGLSLLGNDIPGLDFIERNGLGFTFDLNNNKQINQKLVNVIDNLNQQKNSSLNYSKNYNYLNELRKILNII